jgi:hypothetical protein
MISEPYHSALANGRLENVQPLKRHEATDGIAMAHDLFNPLPTEYDNVNCFYSELPWPAGAKKFDERVGISGRAFSDLIMKVAGLIENDSRPFMLSISKNALRWLPAPVCTHNVLLPSSKANCLVASWNYVFEPRETTLECASDLIAAHGVVGDFACGYGQTGSLARKLGKRWLLSDYNESCIGFIATRLP